MISMEITSPLPRQVYQRYGFDPVRAHHNQPGGPVLGEADVWVRMAFSPPGSSTLECRTVLLGHAFGKAMDWTTVRWADLGDGCEFLVTVPAGGWYRLEVRCIQDGKTVAGGAVEPFGVGEVFLIAGQSYGECWNEKLLRITDPDCRSVAYDRAGKEWVTAHDPLPVFLREVAIGGTVWPPMCDALLPLIRVPIGLVDVAVGGTASYRWTPAGNEFFADLVSGLPLRISGILPASIRDPIPTFLAAVNTVQMATMARISPRQARSGRGLCGLPQSGVSSNERNQR